MKYCTKCGTQLHDEAVICIGCGCPVIIMPPTQTKTVTAPKQSPQKDTLISVFNFIFSTTAILCVFYLLLSLFYASVWTYLKYGYNDSVYFDFSPNYECTIIALICSILSLATAITNLILVSIMKLKSKPILTCVTQLIIGVLLLLLTICSCA